MPTRSRRANRLAAAAPALTEAIDMYLRDCRSRNLSAKTVETYGVVLADVAERLAQAGYAGLVTDLSHEACKEYMVFACETYSDKTAQLRFITLRAFARFCHAERLLSED